MQKIYLTLLLAITFNFAWSQSDNCSGAVSLTNGVCVTGSSAGFTQNIAGCVGNADDDAWYKFVASGTSHSLTVTGSATFDAVLQVFSGTCAALISGGCVDNTGNGQAESFVASGLTIGSTYYVRVYHYFAGSGSSTFTMCLANPPAAPANDICGSAINLSVNAACVNTAGTTFGATQSFAPCAGTSNDDVWYSFAATNYTQTIQVTGSASMDPVVELYDGGCGSLTSLSCTDNTFSGGTETVTASGLTPGVTYYFRVYDYYSTAGNTFSVCVSGTSIIAGSQPNDEPCNAIQIPAVTADCNNLVFSNVGATPTILPGSPGAVCENYDNATNTYSPNTSGAFGTTSKDVWFKITVPASGNIYITPQPNMGAGWIQDGVMALYRGTCGALATYTCSDDYNFIGGYNDMQPFIRALGLTPGETVYLRYGGYGSAGNFGFCVQSPTNDVCANALYICDINGYSATTSPAYKPDWPCNMKGDAETTWNAGTQKYDYAPGSTPSGGPFGLAGTWGVGQPNPVPPYASAYDVQIDNNSWVRFTAASPTVSLRVTVSNCWGTAANSATSTIGTPKGVQMQIFSTSSACCGFTPVSDYRENVASSFVGGISTYTVNANSLTTGNDYYVMVDGWGNDICNYNIQAISGVSLPAIIAAPGTICAGQTTTLTAPAGATSYTWEPTGQNTQTISVAPGTQMTYTCFVGGVCGYKQTLTKTVFLYTTPTVTLAVPNPTICNGKSVTFTAGGASTYTWTGGITNGVAFSPTITNTYTVTATSVNGCTNTAVNTVTVNTPPTITPAGTNTICNGASTSLTASGASTYTWSPSATLSPSTGNAVTASPTIGTNYTIIGTDAATTCTNSATYSVTVNAKPTVSLTASSNTICNGGSVTLTGGGTAAPYTWTGGVTDGVAFNPSSTLTYTVTGTNAVTGCTNQAVKTISVNATPTITPAGTNTICNGSNASLTAGGASTYTWSPSATLSSATGSIVTATPTSGTLYTIIGTSANSCTSSATYSVTVNPKPTISSTVSNSVICKGGSTTLSGTGANTYTWTNPVINGSAFSPTTTSTYTVTGTNTLTGCTNTAVNAVTVNSIPTTTLSTTGTITCATPTINLNSTAVAGATYTWTAPGSSSISGGTVNNQNAIGQGAGTYTLNVLSSALCPYTATLAANINTTTPTASATGGTLTCTNTSTVLTGSPTSGVTYSWSGPGISGSTTSANATATIVGSYSLITTNTLTGCSNSIAAIATVTNNLTTPTVSAGSNQIITCAIPSVTLTGSATAGSSLSWSNGSTTNTTTVGGAGTYTLTATNLGSGCFLTSTVQVLPSAGTPTGAVGAVTNSITCTNTSVAVSITTTVAPITYSWTGPGTIASPTSSATTVSSGGTYTVTITNTASCSQSYPVVVPTNTAAVVASASISPTSSITCTTSTVILGSTPQGPEYTYSWSGPSIISGGTSATPVVGATGNYSVTVTNTITGCTNTLGSAVVFVPTNTTAPLLTLSNNSITTTCGAPSTTVSASSNADPNSTYTWTAPGTGTIDNISVSTPSIGGSGVFTVAVTNTVNGCISAISTVTITPDVNTPTYSLGSNTSTITCAIPSPSVTLTSTVSGVTYSWSPTPGSGITTANPTFTATGNYTCTITNPANGCSNNAAQVAVGINTLAPGLNVTPSESITCSSSTVIVTSTVNTTSTYTWSSAGIQGSVNSSSIIANAIGDYTLTVTDAINGCTTTTISTVGTNTVPPTLTLSATSTVITCSTTSSTLTAIPSTTDTPTWVTPSGASATNPVTATTSGDYVATVIDATNGCKTKDSITIIIDITPPNANAGAGVVMPCSLSTATLLGSSTTTDAVSYSWSGPNAGSITSATNIASPTVNSVGVYTLTVTNLVTGCTETATVNVTSDNVTADFTADPMTGDAPLTVNFTNTSLSATSYTWSFGNGGSSTNQNPNTVFNTAGTYSVILIASSATCSDTVSKIIIVEDGFTIEIPNVFTPNNDGANDAFHIKITGVKSAEGYIYNRWGQLLYSWDVLNVSWDGKGSNGEICPDATYYYLIKVIDKKGKEHIAPGYVLIIR